MDYKSLYILAAIITVLIINSTSCESENFQFNLQKLNSEERDKFFTYLDLNKNFIITQNEFKLLLKSLFSSTKLEKPNIIDEDIEEELFGLLDFNNNKKIDKEEFNKIWEKWIKGILNPKSALIVVDMQNDFIADNGSMTIKNAKTIVPIINRLITSVKFETIVYTYDWHPSNHCSFIENRNLREILPQNNTNNDFVVFKSHPNLKQNLWPKHGVQNTKGAELYKDLIIAKNSLNVRKGMDPDIDSYSAFFDNGRIHKSELSDKLIEKGITDVYLSGVAYEYCVGLTAIDALYLGFRTAFIEDAVYSIQPNGRLNMRNKLIEKNASIVRSEEVPDMVNGKDRKLEMGLVLAQKVFNKLKCF